MTSIANRSLEYRFREIADKAIAFALVTKIHHDTETEYADKYKNYWRDVESLGMWNPPGVALLDKDGNVSIIKWPTEKEVIAIVAKNSMLYHIELLRNGFRYTYAVRTKS